MRSRGSAPNKPRPTRGGHVDIDRALIDRDPRAALRARPAELELAHAAPNTKLCRWEGTRPGDAGGPVPAPEHWSSRRKAAMRAVSKSQRARRGSKAPAHPPIEDCAFGLWLRDTLAAGGLHLYPLDERKRERQALPPSAKWTITIWHREALRVFVTAQLACKRPGGLIITADTLGEIIGCGRGKAGKLVRELVRWNFLVAHPRSKPAPGGERGRHRTADRFVVTPFAIAYYDIRGRKSTRTVTGTSDPDVSLRQAETSAVATEIAPTTNHSGSAPSNPDGTQPAQLLVESRSAKRSSRRDELSGDCDRRAGSSVSAAQRPTIVSESLASRPPATPTSTRHASSRDPRALLAPDGAGFASQLLVATPPVDAKLSPRVAIAPPPRLSDDEQLAEQIARLARRQFGELEPGQLAALAELAPTRNGGAS